MRSEPRPSGGGGSGPNAHESVYSEQMVLALRQAEAGTPVEEICRKLGITESTFYRWKKRFGGLGVSEVRERRQLREEHRKLKGLVTDLSLDKRSSTEALRKAWWPVFAQFATDHHQGSVEEWNKSCPTLPLLSQPGTSVRI